MPVSNSSSTIPSFGDVEQYVDNHGILEAYGMTNKVNMYYLSLYWGFQSLTNLGYSDLMPANAYEMLLGWTLCVFQVRFCLCVLCLSIPPHLVSVSFLPVDTDFFPSCIALFLRPSINRSSFRSFLTRFSLP